MACGRVSDWTATMSMVPSTQLLNEAVVSSAPISLWASSLCFLPNACQYTSHTSPQAAAVMSRNTSGRTALR